MYIFYGSPGVFHYIHKKYAFHLHNMGVLWFDLQSILNKTLYQWKSKAIRLGYKTNFLHFKRIPRTFLNKVGLIKSRLKCL